MNSPAPQSPQDAPGGHASPRDARESDDGHDGAAMADAAQKVVWFHSGLGKWYRRFFSPHVDIFISSFVAIFAGLYILASSLMAFHWFSGLDSLAITETFVYCTIFLTVGAILPPIFVTLGKYVVKSGEQTIEAAEGALPEVLERLAAAAKAPLPGE